MDYELVCDLGSVRFIDGHTYYLLTDSTTEFTVLHTSFMKIVIAAYLIHGMMS
jgi:hypothetical protein